MLLQVVIPVAGDPMELELYPYTVRLYRHQTPPSNPTSAGATASGGGGGTLQRGGPPSSSGSSASLGGAGGGAATANNSNGSQIMGLGGNGVFSGLIEGLGSITSNISWWPLGLVVSLV